MTLDPSSVQLRQQAYIKQNYLKSQGIDMAGNKRKHGQDSSNELYSNKSRAKPTMEARVDPTYGQRSALPGLDDIGMDGSDEELNYDDQDALSYLKAVRKEASGIPNLLVAPKHSSSDGVRDIYENGVGDFRGWYEDGAYCAAPQESSPTSYKVAEDIYDTGKDPQLVYFDSILSRYEALRAQLQQTPPREAVARLDKDHPTHMGGTNAANIKWWKRNLRESNPVPVQVASMDKETVLKLLGVMAKGALLQRGADVVDSVSRWVWALLARLPDRGELTSEEIGVIRELGKKAVLVGTGLKEDQALEEAMDEMEADFNEDDYEEVDAVANDDEINSNLDMGLEECDLDPAGYDTSASEENEPKKRQKIGPQLPADHLTIEPSTEDKLMPGSISFVAINSDDGGEDGELPDEDLAAAKARILAALDYSKVEEAQQEPMFVNEDTRRSKKVAANWNTKATVDMIITVVGEAYGQLDLLEFRQSWGPVAEA